MQALPVPSNPPATAAQPLSELWAQTVGFLPAFVGGLAMVGIGFVLGWLAKRAVVRMLVWLRLDRLASRVGWRAAFGKGDVRSALYNVVGNVVLFLVLLIFLDDALERWGLTGLARIVAGLIVYLPNLAIVLVIVALGFTVSNAAGSKVADALAEEGVTRARIIGKAVKATLVSVSFVLALWQLHFARELVFAGFVICFGSVGVAFAIGLGIGTAKAIERGLVGLFHKEKEDR
ncbi:MAG: mechanosensitive ion channel family protein [Hyphomicrobiales bacterium]